MQTVPTGSNQALTAAVFMKLTCALSPHHRPAGQEDQLINLILHI